jgi:arabinan endo-1,5-alpha-L-arabinosidase
MKDTAYLIADSATVLATPNGAPFDFTITISEEKENVGAERTFEVMEKEPGTGLEKTRRYQLSGNGHSFYLDLFGKLAADFGLRLPQNRRQLNAKPTFKAAYREVLRDNLDPGMLYGYGDPAVLRVPEDSPEGDKYYLLSTSNDAPNSFPIIRSRDLINWEFVGYVFPQGNKPAWAADGELISDYWAPELHQVVDEFRVYFVAREKHTLELCIGLAKSSRPEGPFIPEAEPILKGNVIDPHVFVQEDGTAYLYWKEDNNDVWPGQLIELLYDHPGFINKLFATAEDQVTASFMVTLWPWARTLPPMERFLLLQTFIEAVIAVYADFYGRLTGLAEGQPAPIQDKINAVQKFMKTPMYAQRLSADGTQLAGARTKIIENDLA